MRQRHDQPFLLQIAQRLANRGPADLHPLGDLALADRFAHAELPAGDGGPQAVEHLLAKHQPRRWRKRGVGCRAHASSAPLVDG